MMYCNENIIVHYDIKYINDFRHNKFYKEIYATKNIKVQDCVYYQSVPTSTDLYILNHKLHNNLI